MQLRSNPAVVLVNGFSGSQENVAGGPILRRGGLGFVSGSATRASLTDPTTPDGHVLSNGYFHRVVPNDNFQGSVDVAFMLKKLGIKSGDKVMTVDQAEAYSVPLITLMTQPAHEGQASRSTASRSLRPRPTSRRWRRRPWPRRRRPSCSPGRSPRTPSCSCSS